MNTEQRNGKTIIPTIPHILEDTRDFLSRLNQLRDIPDNTLFVTLDLVGLYPHIRHAEGLETMKRYLDKREDQSVSSDSLNKLAKIIPKPDFFELGQNIFHQILGTTISTKLCKHFCGTIGKTNFQ